MQGSGTPLHVRKLAVFFFLCVNARLLLALLAFVATRAPQPWVLPIAGVILGLLPGIAFLVRFATSSARAPGAVFGDPAWWHPLRAVHGAMFLTFGILALLRVRWAWAVLLADVAIGLAAFAIHYGRVERRRTGPRRGKALLAQ
jgi:hypothetical protein